MRKPNWRKLLAFSLNLTQTILLTDFCMLSSEDCFACWKPPVWFILPRASANFGISIASVIFSLHVLFLHSYRVIRRLLSHAKYFTTISHSLFVLNSAIHSDCSRSVKSYFFCGYTFSFDLLNFNSVNWNGEWSSLHCPG